MKFKPYKKYRNSGIIWVGEAPKHWKTTKLKRCFKVFNGKEISNELEIEDDNGIDVYGSGGKFKKTDKFLYNSESVLFGRKGTIGKPIYVTGKFWTVDTMYYTKFYNNMFPKWFYYMLTIFPWEKYTTKTALPSIVGTDIENCYAAIPSYQEQKNIANFLDEKCKQINQIIELKMLQIEVLQKYRQSLISETVSKGLGPSVKMKDSGIEWIGEIPEHWNMKRLKYLFYLNPNKSEVKNLKREDLVSFISMDKITGPGIIDYSSVREYQEVNNGYTYFTNKDLIMAKVTPCFENRNIAIVENLTNGVGFGSTEFYVLRKKGDIVPEYYYYFFQTPGFINEGTYNMYGVAGLKRITPQFLENYSLPLPTINEQKEIVEFLDKKIGEIDMVIKKIHEQIEVLENYRQSLIYEAVTGKIDVSNYEFEKQEVEK